MTVRYRSVCYTLAATCALVACQSSFSVDDGEDEVGREIDTYLAAETRPVLESVEVTGAEVTLSWLNPAAPRGPEGGFELMVDSARTYTTLTPRVEGGEARMAMTFTLDEAAEPAERCFQVYARFNSGYVASNARCATVPALPQEPVAQGPQVPRIEDVVAEGGAVTLRWSLAESDVGEPQGGFDFILDGRDTGESWRVAPGTRAHTLEGLEAGERCWRVEARYTQLSPKQAPRSETVCVDVTPLDPGPEPQPEPDPPGGDPVGCDKDEDAVDWAALVAASSKVHRVDSHASMQAALDVVKAGEAIVLADGVYRDWSSLKVRRDGSASRPIVVTTQARIDGAGRDRVKFIGGKRHARFTGASHYIWGGYSIEQIGEEAFRFDRAASSSEGAHDNRLTDMVIATSAKRRGSAIGLIDIFAHNDRTRIDHNVFRKNYSHPRVRSERVDGRVVASVDTRIDHNLFDGGPEGGFLAGVPYEVGAFQTCCAVVDDGGPIVPFVFEYNTIRNFKRLAEIDAETLEIKTGGAIVRYNSLVDTKGGISLRWSSKSEVYGNVLRRAGGIPIHGSDNLVYSNLIVEPRSGIRISRWGRRQPGNCTTLPASHRNVVAFNTILDARDYGMRIGDCDYGACRPVEDNLIAYNIVTAAQGVLMHYNTADEPGRTTRCAKDSGGDASGGRNRGNRFVGNLIHGSARDGEGASLDSALLRQDPQLEMDAELGVRWRLAADSDLIDAGAWLDELGMGFRGAFGATRQCGLPDIGAFERDCMCVQAP